MQRYQEDMETRPTLEVHLEFSFFTESFVKCFTEASYFCFKPFSHPLDIKCITELYLQMRDYIFCCSIQQPTSDTDGRAQVIFILNFFLFFI